MSFIEDLKATAANFKANQQTEQEPEERLISTIAVGAAVVFAAIIVIAVLALVWMVVKAIFFPALVLLVGYGLGVYFFSWPLPSFLKKVIRK